MLQVLARPIAFRPPAAADPSGSHCIETETLRDLSRRRDPGTERRQPDAAEAPAGGPGDCPGDGGAVVRGGRDEPPAAGARAARGGGEPGPAAARVARGAPAGA